MEIYITGDLHVDLRRFQPEIFYEQVGLTKEDIVLVAGDLGCVWYGDEQDNEGLDWLKGRPFTTAFITGNHENYDALRKYPFEEWRDGNIRRIRPPMIVLERGQIFDLGEKRFFTLGGASSHDIRDGILEPDDLCSREMQSAGCQGYDVSGKLPALVERGADQRGGVQNRQGKLGQSGLGGGLHPHPLLLHLGTG